MNIYVMRHGTTVWNEIGRIQGRSKNRLSHDGKILVEKSAKEIKNIKFDVIYSSPVMRTMQTANIVNKYLGVEIIKDEHITEINQGIFVGRYKNSLSEEEKQIRKVRDKNYGLETYEEVYLRVKDFVHELVSQNKYNNVLVITHSFPATCLEWFLTDTIPNFDNYIHIKDFKNAEVRKYSIPHDKTTIDTK